MYKIGLLTLHTKCEWHAVAIPNTTSLIRVAVLDSHVVLPYLKAWMRECVLCKMPPILFNTYLVVVCLQGNRD